MSSTSSTTPSTKKSNFKILEKLGASPFLGLWVLSNQDNTEYALKIFPYEDNKVSKCFLRESQVAEFNHPNIVKVSGATPKQKTIKSGEIIFTSHLMMELAPYGDFADFLIASDIFSQDEKLLRTYFHQLVEGLEYLHSNGCAHLDIKLDNLLIGDNFELKITDFDNCFVEKRDRKVISQGTNNYRAPELANCECEDPFSADIFSLAVCLFALAHGAFPFKEGSIYKGFDMMDLFTKKPEEFWDVYAMYGSQLCHDSQSLMDLISAMARFNSNERATIQDIKQNEWFKGDIYSKSELAAVMSNLYE
eukprot:CAMPEP_0114592894 /NCGR_PEP_ID=MMETSP0125-20121206/14604_1 /TAXON_ID=485358 ORGANISM="Aristerostoma sp., Strain ATCC 50986" /NCGR_SAMPLE_ID=MMETSP0125 /ASSEMBLY_ACC=CAM_ASM_000245 /LENGTH=305 /DNA_ID=CAMNT_0001791761 /DNA_START=109 /DNA_END=1026 /DNA_ORIENTATION=-